VKPSSPADLDRAAREASSTLRTRESSARSAPGTLSAGQRKPITLGRPPSAKKSRTTPSTPPPSFNPKELMGPGVKVFGLVPDVTRGEVLATVRRETMNPVPLGAMTLLIGPRGGGVRFYLRSAGVHPAGPGMVSVVLKTSGGMEAETVAGAYLSAGGARLAVGVVEK